jgi:hypothetical protein
MYFRADTLFKPNPRRKGQSGQDGSVQRATSLLYSQQDRQNFRIAFCFVIDSTLGGTGKVRAEDKFERIGALPETAIGVFNVR